MLSSRIENTIRPRAGFPRYSQSMRSWRMNKLNGQRILLVGPDGAGKSSLAHELEGWLCALGYEVKRTHFDGKPTRAQARDFPDDGLDIKPIHSVPVSLIK